MFVFKNFPPNPHKINKTNNVIILLEVTTLQKTVKITTT